MDKLKMQTPNLIDKNVEQIARLFPHVMTETKDEDGNSKKAIDFDLLKQSLSDALVDDENERYRLDWPGKKASLLKANTPIDRTLRPCREESVDFDTTENLYIEGDNFEVLKILQESYLGKVKMIYIDPPYNTGNDFIYKDDFKVSKDEYDEEIGAIDEDGDKLFKNTDSNGRFHSDWLSMMYERLVVARDLLKDDGVIFISIDDNEVHNLRKICDEVLGDENFIACFPWKKRSAKSDVPFGVSQDYEWILCFTKGFFLAGLEMERKYYQTPDFVNDRWRLSDLTTQKIEADRPNSAFDLIDPKTKIIYKYNPKRLWGITKDTFKEYYDKGKIVFPDDYEFLNISIPAYRVFESEDKQKALQKYGVENAFKALSTNLPKEVGMTEAGNKELYELFKNKIFSFPKPSSLIKHLISSVKINPTDIILDFFSGSATTAHAVMQLNAEDGGRRKFIMVQLHEKTDEKSEAYKAGYKTIAEIGKERIRRAGKKILEELKKINQQTKLGEEPFDPSKLDIGFRVYKTDDTNMKEVYYHPNELKQGQLEFLESNIKEDRTPEDLLTQVILDLGLELNLPIEKKEILDNTVFIVQTNALIACFDNNINFEIVDEIAELKPFKVVFKNASFKDDKDRINVEERFKRLSPETVITVI